MKTFSFRAKNNFTKEVINCTIEAVTKVQAQNGAMHDTRFKDWTVMLGTFKVVNDSKPPKKPYRETKETNWTDKTVQYPRLLAEIRAIGLSKEQYEALKESMDLTVDEIDDVLEWAETDWQTIKANT